MIERQALSELAILRAIGGTDQTAQALPQVVARALRIDLLERGLLVHTQLIIVFQGVARSLALLLASGAFKRRDQFIELLLQCFGVLIGFRIFQQFVTTIFRVRAQRANRREQLVEFALQLLQAFAFVVRQQGFDERVFTGEYACTLTQLTHAADVFSACSCLR